jgi:carbamoyltransferase
MHILGISISHDSSSCLLKDGNIVFYHEDERFSKIKHNSINHRRPNPFLYYQSDNIKKHTNFIDNIIFSSYGDDPYDFDIISSVLGILDLNGIRWNNVIFNNQEHHLYHASNAAFSSGFEECACLIIDGAGASIEHDSKRFNEIESIYSFDYKNGIQKKFKHYSQLGGGYYDVFDTKRIDDCDLVFSDSIGCGALFGLFSKSMGFDSGFDSGKIMGLASYGSNLTDYGDWFFSMDGVELTNNNLNAILLKKISNLSLREKQDILKTLQVQTKKHTINLIKKAIGICNTKNIVLSGGYFLNCVNNYHYLKEFPEINFYVDPISHDGGTSLGSSKYLWWKLTKDDIIRKLDTLYLGQS